eukprot:jgi/Bigna1/68394/fgenesh1_pg.6_\
MLAHSWSSPIPTTRPTDEWGMANGNGVAPKKRLSFLGRNPTDIAAMGNAIFRLSFAIPNGHENGGCFLFRVPASSYMLSPVSLSLSAGGRGSTSYSRVLCRPGLVVVLFVLLVVIFPAATPRRRLRGRDAAVWRGEIDRSPSAQRFMTVQNLRGGADSASAFGSHQGQGGDVAAAAVARSPTREGAGGGGIEEEVRRLKANLKAAVEIQMSPVAAGVGGENDGGAQTQRRESASTFCDSLLSNPLGPQVALETLSEFYGSSRDPSLQIWCLEAVRVWIKHTLIIKNITSPTLDRGESTMRALGEAAGSATVLVDAERLFPVDVAIAWKDEVLRMLQATNGLEGVMVAVRNKYALAIGLMIKW